MEYILLTDTQPKSLSNQVIRYLDKGWQLYGSPSIAVDDVVNYYAQALIRK